MAKALVFVEGNVQGVSFRAYAKQLARKLGLRGLARNLEDGRVRLFLDGHEGAIMRFVDLVKSKKGDASNPFSLHVQEAVAFLREKKDSLVRGRITRASTSITGRGLRHSRKRTSNVLKSGP